MRGMNPTLIIFGSGLLAGAMNALAGGGTFVALPALISVGVPSVMANASSTVGLFPGTAASALLPWLLLIATLTLTFARHMGEFLRRRWQIRPAAVLVIQLALGIYGGYFGGAVGLMMMAVWGLLGNRDLKSLNAPRTLLVTAANTMAVLVFVIAQAVHWSETLILLGAATIGGYSGALVGRRAAPRVIRAATLLIAFGITLLFFVRAYVKAFP